MILFDRDKNRLTAPYESELRSRIGAILTNTLTNESLRRIVTQQRTSGRGIMHLGKKRDHGKRVLVCLVAGLMWIVAASAQQRAIDAGKSLMTVRVYKAGFLSALGHDHEIAAPITRGRVDATSGHVELYVSAGALQVRDPKASDKDRAEIQKTMLGPEVLDGQQYPEIVFRSSSAQPIGAGNWKVSGNLMLHGETRALVVEVRVTGGHYVGTTSFKQTDFGIKPVKVAGGSIRVKDQVRMEFDVQLAR